VSTSARLDKASEIAILASVGTQLRCLRQDQGMLLSQLADQIGLSASVLCRLELARREPSIHQLMLVCCVLGVRPSAVLHHAEDEAFPLGLAPWPSSPDDTDFIRPCGP
jgi:transcriptional regulator with XRE-family HTH domain